MRRSALVALMLAAALPARAGGAELYLGLDLEGSYESNVFGLPVHELDDFSIRATPGLRATDRDGHLRWELQYRPAYERYAEFADLEGWDQDASGWLEWAPNERDTIRLGESYLDTSNYLRFASDVVGTPEVEFLIGRERVERNVLDASWERLLRPRHAVTTRLARYDNEFSREGRPANATTAASLSYLYAWSSLTRVGILLSATQQEVGGLLGAEDRKIYYYNASLQWITQLTRTLSLQASAGPALVDADRTVPELVVTDVLRFPGTSTASGGRAPIRASSCPTLDDGTPFRGAGCEPLDRFTPSLDYFQRVDVALAGPFPEESTGVSTYFASLGLEKTWETVTANLSYSRDASTLEGSQVNDTVDLGVTWSATRRLQLFFSSGYQRSSAATESTLPVFALRAATVGGTEDVAEVTAIRLLAVESDARSETIWAQVRCRYRLTRQVSLFARASWLRQASRSDAFDVAPVDRLLVSVGFSFLYGPMDLPI